MQRSASESTLSLPHRSVERLTPLPWRCLGGSAIGHHKESVPTLPAPSFPSKLRTKLAKCQTDYVQMKAADEVEMQAMKAKERTTNMIKQLSEEASKLEELIPNLPTWLQKLFSNKEFNDLVTDKFQQYDTAKRGFLSSEEVFPMLVSLTHEQPVSLTMEHCVRFVEVFDADKSGTLDIQEFRDFLRFSLAMAYLEAKSAGGDVDGEEMVDAILEEAKIDREKRKSKESAEQRLEFMIETMESKGMLGLDAIVPQLPVWLKDDLMNPEFKQNCDAHFMRLDEDGSGALSLEEIYPMLLEITGEKPLHIEKKHCHRFICAFDSDGNGCLDIEEFTNFVRFAMAMCYLEGERVKEQQRQAQIRLQETMAKVSGDMQDMDKIIKTMPEPVRKMMDNVEYTKTFKDRWNALDSDRSGTLEIEELFPIVQELCETSEIEGAKLDSEQCAEFAKLFDENGDGVINQKEFADFIRFCLVMSYVDAQKAAEAEVEAIADPSKRDSLKPKRVSLIDAADEDLELFKMSADEEKRIAKIQAAYRGKKDRQVVAKKKEQKELQDWTDDIGEDADKMAAKLQAIHKKKQQKRDSMKALGDTDDMQAQLNTLQKKKKDRENFAHQKRKSDLAQEGATGGVDTLFAALADEEIHGDGPIEGDFDVSQLSEEHQAMLAVNKAATETTTEVMRKRKEEAERQQEREKKWREERFHEELRNWALSFGQEGHDAAMKIQQFWKGGQAQLLVQKAREQVEIETYDNSPRKKKGKQDKLQKELQEWEAQQDPKELNAAALKVQAAQRQKQAKKEVDQKKKERFHTAKTSPLSPRDKKRGLLKNKDLSYLAESPKRRGRS